MAATYKVLGQSNPSAGALTTLYTVPAGKTAVVSSITVCNLSSSQTGTFRIAVRVAAASITNAQYISYDVFLDLNETKAYTLGLTLGATDVVSVYSSNTSISFSAFGSEIV
jgi:hypothetical protein